MGVFTKGDVKFVEMALDAETRDAEITRLSTARIVGVICGFLMFLVSLVSVLTGRETGTIIALTVYFFVVILHLDGMVKFFKLGKALDERRK